MVHNITASYVLRWQKEKTYSHSYAFCQIICPLNKHHRNKHNFGKIFEIQRFVVDINNNGISCNCYVKINKILLNKGKLLDCNKVSTNTW